MEAHIYMCGEVVSSISKAKWRLESTYLVKLYLPYRRLVYTCVVRLYLLYLRLDGG